jgi:hypothetical protein
MDLHARPLAYQPVTNMGAVVRGPNGYVAVVMNAQRSQPAP